MTNNLEDIARDFHETYERLAPSFGYETRKETKQFDAKSPNGRLMIAVCNEVSYRVRRQAFDEMEKKLLKEIEAYQETFRYVEQPAPVHGAFVWAGADIHKIIKRVRKEVE